MNWVLNANEQTPLTADTLPMELCRTKLSRHSTNTVI